MHVFIDALSVRAGWNLGGQTYVQGLVNSLVEMDRDNEYTVLVTAGNRELFALRSPTARPYVAPINNSRRMTRLLYEQLWLPVIARSLRTDVVHFPGNLIPLLSGLSRIASVVTVHDLSPFFYQRNFPGHAGRMEMIIKKRLYKYSLGHSDIVVTDSEFSRREILSHFDVAPEKVVVIYPGCTPLPRMETGIDAVLRRYGVSKPYVLALGRTNKHKNFDGLARAFSQAKKKYGLPHNLVIAGPPGSGHQDLLSAIEGTGAGAFTRLTGYVDAIDLAGLYQGAELMAMPSLYEGFGFPVIEAMHLGVPTLVSNAASLPEVAGDATVYVDPGNIDSMADTLGGALTDGALLLQLGEKGKIQAAKFSWQRAAVQTLPVWRRATELARS